jgi:hypothetical protein
MDGSTDLVVVAAAGMQILSPQLEPLAEAQRMLVGGLQHTSTQAEDALSQGMEKLQQNLAETLTAEADPFGPPDAYMLQMATAVGILKELVNFVTQVNRTGSQRVSHPSFHLRPWMQMQGLASNARGVCVPVALTPVRARAPLLGALAVLCRRTISG